MSRVPILVIAVFVVGVGGAGFGDFGHSGTGRAAPGSGDPRLRLSGHLDGLYPGAQKRLRVRVKSRLPFAVKVRWIRARVGNGGPGCSQRNLRVRRYRGHLRIPPHRSRRVTLRIVMASRAPAACQGARFPIRFRARATR